MYFRILWRRDKSMHYNISSQYTSNFVKLDAQFVDYEYTIIFFGRIIFKHANPLGFENQAKLFNHDDYNNILSHS